MSVWDTRKRLSGAFWGVSCRDGLIIRRYDGCRYDRVLSSFHNMHVRYPSLPFPFHFLCLPHSVFYLLFHFVNYKCFSCFPFCFIIPADVDSLLVALQSRRMNTMDSIRQVILEGGLPWGFRIQGGSDSGHPLRIARVSTSFTSSFLFQLKRHDRRRSSKWTKQNGHFMPMSKLL